MLRPTEIVDMGLVGHFLEEAGGLGGERGPPLVAVSPDGRCVAFARLEALVVLRHEAPTDPVVLRRAGDAATALSCLAVHPERAAAPSSQERGASSVCYVLLVGYQSGALRVVAGSGEPLLTLHMHPSAVVQIAAQTHGSGQTHAGGTPLASAAEASAAASISVPADDASVLCLHAGGVVGHARCCDLYAALRPLLAPAALAHTRRRASSRGRGELDRTSEAEALARCFGAFRISERAAGGWVGLASGGELPSPPLEVEAGLAAAAAALVASDQDTGGEGGRGGGDPGGGGGAGSSGGSGGGPSGRRGGGVGGQGQSSDRGRNVAGGAGVVGASPVGEEVEEPPSVCLTVTDGSSLQLHLLCASRAHAGDGAARHGRPDSHAWGGEDDIAKWEPDTGASGGAIPQGVSGAAGGHGGSAGECVGGGGDGAQSCARANTQSCASDGGAGEPSSRCEAASPGGGHSGSSGPHSCDGQSGSGSGAHSGGGNEGRPSSSSGQSSSGGQSTGGSRTAALAFGSRLGGGAMSLLSSLLTDRVSPTAPALASSLQSGATFASAAASSVAHRLLPEASIIGETAGVRWWRDGARQFQAVWPDPRRRFVAASDSLGRVVLLEPRTLVVLRVWKGYRDAVCAWVDQPVMSEVGSAAGPEIGQPAMTEIGSAAAPGMGRIGAEYGQGAGGGAVCCRGGSDPSIAPGMARGTGAVGASGSGGSGSGGGVGSGGICGMVQGRASLGVGAVLVILAPRREMLELWAVPSGVRLRAVATGAGCVLLGTAPPLMPPRGGRQRGGVRQSGARAVGEGAEGRVGAEGAGVDEAVQGAIARPAGAQRLGLGSTRDAGAAEDDVGLVRGYLLHPSGALSLIVPP